MRPRLLVVDDDPDNVQGMLMILGRKYWVLGCQSAQDALHAIEDLRPDLLVLDILMRPLDGMRCLELIRARPGYGDIPAVAITAQARPADRQRIIAAGFEAVFAKPILDYPALLRSIESLLSPRASEDGPAPEREPGGAAATPVP